MRQTDKMTRVLASALLAGLSFVAPLAGAERPDTPPTPSLPADLPPIAAAPAEVPPQALDEIVPDEPGELAVDLPAEAPAEPSVAEWASPDAAEALLLTAQVDPKALGPLSIGTPDSGLLLNPVPLSPGSLWKVRNPSESWGTSETIDFIVSAIEAVEDRHPGSPPLVIGDLSNPRGGKLNRHRSHQAGRDADIGFYFQRGEVDSFVAPRKKDLDLPRTWALVRAFLTLTDVERIFVDRSLIGVLYQHAVAEGEDRSWLDDVFGRTSEKGIIQHERRHKDHLHVRFYNPLAQEHGRVVYPVLVETGAAPPPMVKHRVRQGETLGSLARRYGTSVSAIRAANGLRSSRLRAGRSYTIPIRRTPPDTGPVVVPPRRLPPDMAAQATAPAPAEPTPDTGAAAQR
jgi:murein endopeptidase